MIKYKQLLQSKRITFALTLLVLVPLFIAFTGLLNPKVKASWIAPEWQYRQLVSIDAHSTTENNVYVVLPDFDATDPARFLADCGDLRFTKLNGEELQYYVAECSATSEVHVNFDTLPSGISGFYMYHGNDLAADGFEVSPFSTAATGLGNITFSNEEFREKSIAHWEMNEATWDGTPNEILDTSGNGYTGTAVGGATTSPDGKYDRAGSFDDINDVAQMAYVNPGSNLTISAWVKPDTYPTGIGLGNETPNIIVSADRGGCANIRGVNPYMLSMLNGRLIYVVAQTVSCSTGYSNDQYYANNPALTIGEYSHIVVTVQNNTAEARVVSFYVNGQKYTHSQTANNPSTSAFAGTGFNTFVGAKNHLYNQGFGGLVDDVKIYNRVLSDQEISDNYYWGVDEFFNGNVIGSTAGASLPAPLLHYKLDEQGGQTVHNAVNSSFDGTFGANTSVATDDPLWNNDDVCRTNACGNFDGTNDYINVGNIGNLGTVYSVSLWAKYVSGGGSTMISYRTDTLTTTTNVAFQIDGSGSDHRFLVRNNAGTIATTTSTGTLNSEWNHIVGVRDGNALTIYVNGVKRHTASASLGAITMNKLTIGGLYLDNINTMETGSHFRGSIDEVKIFAEALTDEQVRLDYNADSALNVGTTANTLGASLTGGNGNAPVAEYKFEENTGTSTNDSSTNNSTGTLNNGTTWTAGKIGSAIVLDGVDDNVTFPSSTPLNLGASDFTIEAYVKGNNLENNDIIVGKTDGGACSTTYGYSLGVFDSLYPTLHFCTAAGSHAKVQGTQTLSNNQWYHIVVVVDRDNTTNTRMYVNGIAVTTTVANLATHTGSITNTVNLAIGSESDNGFNWSGEIDQVRIYNYVRNQTQIMYNFNKGGPVGWWKFDQTSGTVAYDSSEYASNGTLVNMDPATDWITDGSCPFNNNCLDFDNVNDTVTVPYSTRYDPGNSFSVGAWVYPRTYASCTNPDYADFVISKGNDNVAGAFYISICTGGTSTFVIRSNSGGHSAPAGTGSVPLNQWTHLFGTFDGTTLRYYVNGVLRATVTPGAVTVPAYNALLRIGSNSTPSFPYYFNGKIDDVRIYKYPLSTTQVQQIYNNGAALLYE